MPVRAARHDLRAMTWWCSGEAAVPWTWEPQPYLGIWLVMVSLAVGYILAVRWYARQPGGHAPSRTQLAAAVAGWFLLWVATDWPLGTLSAGYLLTASMIQIMLYYYVVAPLIIRATPRGLRDRLLTHPRARILRPVVSRPLVAFVPVNLVLTVTHIPAVADFLKATQLGTMAMDLVWLTTGVLFWWALDAYRPADPNARFFKLSVYITASKIVPTVIGVILTFHNFPLYTTYEFANRVWMSFSALEDQQVAGLVMLLGMMPLLVLRLGLAAREAHLAGGPGSAGRRTGAAVLHSKGGRDG